MNELQELIRSVLGIKQAQDALVNQVAQHGTAIADFAAIKKLGGELSMRMLDIEQKAAKLGDGSNVAPLSRGMASRAAIQLLLKGRENDITRLVESRGRVQLQATTPIATKALTSLQGSGDSPPAGFSVLPGSGGIITEPPRALTFLAAIDHVPISNANTVESVRFVDPDSPAPLDMGAEVQENEGDLKATVELHAESQQTRLDTIAVWTRVSKQLLADVPLLGATLQSMFVDGVASRAERIAIAKLVSEATPYVSMASALPDKISEALAGLEGANYTQPLIIVHPQTWHDLRTSRATGGSEEYLAGSWAEPAQPNIWGTPVIRNSAVSQSQLLIVDRSASRYLDRQLPAVLLSTEDQDNVVKNLVTILAEMRGALDITRPNGVLGLALS